MTKRGKKAADKERRESETGGRNYLRISDELDSQMTYLLEIAGLLRYLFEGKTTAIIPLSSVLDDLYDRLEHLKLTIEELKGFFLRNENHGKTKPFKNKGEN